MAAACAVLLGVAPQGGRWFAASDSGEELAFLRGKRRAEEAKAATAPEPPVVGVFLDVALVELQVESVPWRIAKVLVPMAPQVARWWTHSGPRTVVARIDRPLTGGPRIHVQVSGEVPFEVGDVVIRGIHAVIDLPEDTILEECRLAAVRVTADLEPLAGLGPINALMVDCPVRMPGGNMMSAAREALTGRNPFRWMLLPWLLLLLPFIMGYSIGPMALVGGACLTLMSIASLSFIIVVIIIVIQRRCAQCTRRWRRLWRLRALTRRPARITTAFGVGGPCCICLADHREALIALLPCRHSLHDECYASWVRADAYPSPDLICPLCRCRADAIGKLGA